MQQAWDISQTNGSRTKIWEKLWNNNSFLELLVAIIGTSNLLVLNFCSTQPNCYFAEIVNIIPWLQWQRVKIFLKTRLLVNYRVFHGNCQKLKDYYSAHKALYSLWLVGKFCWYPAILILTLQKCLIDYQNFHLLGISDL